MDFVTTAQNFGVAVACLISLSIGVAWGIRWIGKYVALPLVNSHVEFLKFLQDKINEQGEMHKENVRRLDELQEAVSIRECRFSTGK